MELHARHDRRLLRDRRVPAPHAGCHGHRRRRRLGPVDTVAGGRQLERRRHRRPPGVPRNTLPAEAVREVPALRDDGVLVLGPHGRFVPLQPLVPRLQVRLIADEDTIREPEFLTYCSIYDPDGWVMVLGAVHV